jgi:hypothetical protein
MKNKKIIYLTGIAVAGALTITGCGKKEAKEEIPVETEAKEEMPVVTYTGPSFEHYFEDPGPTTKKPYEHLLFKKYRVLDSDNGVDYYSESPIHVDQASIDVPEGYMPVGVGPISNTSNSRYNPTTQEQVWFVNYVPVEVQPVYNEDNMYYDYSDFGTPLKYEKEDMNYDYSDYSMPLESEEQVMILK